MEGYNGALLTFTNKEIQVLSSKYKYAVVGRMAKFIANNSIAESLKRSRFGRVQSQHPNSLPGARKKL
ncbi:unnamed protein product [Cuscuta campestris]|uniref:Uncharacterized protein n=1 Tax=Cuscuta campestris TaxID=132261 RepID=A0A484KZA3_9ASTE|nr:unnamed protein product [Cuscuta campestris]